MSIQRRWIWTIFLFLSFFTILAVLIKWFVSDPGQETTGSVRVSSILPRIVFEDKDSQEPMPNYERFRNTEAARMASDVVLNRVADKLVKHNLGYFNGRSDLRLELYQAIRKGNIAIHPIVETELINLKMISRFRDDAEKIIDAFLDSYLEVVTFDEARGGNETIRILEDQRKALSDKMDRQRETIAQLIGEYGTQELTPRQDMMLQQVDSLQRELINVNIRRISLETRLKMQESLPSDGDSITPEMQERRNTIVNTDPGIQALMGEVRRYESLVAEAEQNLKESNPEMQRRKAMLVNLNERLDQRRKQVTDEFDKTYQGQTARHRNRQLAEVKAELAQTIEYEQQIAAKMEQMDTKTIDVGRKQFAINDQQEQLTRTKETYNEICKRIEEIEVESKRPARISIAFRASSVPLGRSRPYRMVVLAIVDILLLVCLLRNSVALARSRAPASTSTA